MSAGRGLERRPSIPEAPPGAGGNFRSARSRVRSARSSWHGNPWRGCPARRFRTFPDALAARPRRPRPPRRSAALDYAPGPSRACRARAEGPRRASAGANARVRGRRRVDAPRRVVRAGVVRVRRARAAGPASASARPATSPSDEAAVRAIRESMLAAAGAASTPPSADRATPGAASTWTTAASSDDDSGVRVAGSRVEPGARVVFRVRAAAAGGNSGASTSPAATSRSARSSRASTGSGASTTSATASHESRASRASATSCFWTSTTTASRSCDGLECVPNLRVLMLGRNRITSLGGHGSFTLRRACPKLDVLDLHDNDVETLAGADALLPSSIRVPARLTRERARRPVGDLGGLTNLAELNLRRCGVRTLPPALPATRRSGGSSSPATPRGAGALAAAAPLRVAAPSSRSRRRARPRARGSAGTRMKRPSAPPKPPSSLEPRPAADAAGEPVAASADAESLSGGSGRRRPGVPRDHARVPRAAARPTEKKEGASPPRRDFERTADGGRQRRRRRFRARDDASEACVSRARRAAPCFDGSEASAPPRLFRSQRGGGSAADPVPSTPVPSTPRRLLLLLLLLPPFASVRRCVRSSRLLRVRARLSLRSESPSGSRLWVSLAIVALLRGEESFPREYPPRSASARAHSPPLRLRIRRRQLAANRARDRVGFASADPRGAGRVREPAPAVPDAPLRAQLAIARSRGPAQPGGLAPGVPRAFPSGPRGRACAAARRVGCARGRRPSSPPEGRGGGSGHVRAAAPLDGAAIVAAEAGLICLKMDEACSGS